MRIPTLALAALGLAASSAHAQSSPTTITPDRATTLVSKDINGQRWAIARDHATGAVSGNVFVPGSPDPQFVWCRQTGDGPAGYTYDCFGTGQCSVPDCATSWSVLTSVVLPHAFFEAGAPGPTPTPQPGQCPTDAGPARLDVDCSHLVYLYRSTSIAAAMSSDGTFALVCISDGRDSTSCGRGPVLRDTLALLTEGNFNNGSFFDLDTGSQLQLFNRGQRVGATFVVDGEPFQFGGLNWYGVEASSSASVEAVARGIAP